MKRGRQQIQKTQLTPLEKALLLSRVMTRDEKIAVIKEFAGQLGEPLYTVQDVRQIVNNAIAATARRQPLLDGVKDFAEQMGLVKP